MIEILKGMIGFIFAGLIFTAGYFYGLNSGCGEKDMPLRGYKVHDDPVVSEEEMKKREKIKKGVNNIATYAGMKGGDRTW